MSSRDTKEGFDKSLAETASQDDAERTAAIKRLIARMTRGADLGGIRVSREEMHER